jgi:hypothetical protein
MAGMGAAATARSARAAGEPAVAGLSAIDPPRIRAELASVTVKNFPTLMACPTKALVQQDGRLGLNQGRKPGGMHRWHPSAVPEHSRLAFTPQTLDDVGCTSDAGILQKVSSPDVFKVLQS